MKRVLTALIAVVLSTVVLFSGCAKEVTTKDDKALNETVVMTAGDIKITQADYNFLYKIMYEEMSQYSQYYGDDWINTEIDEEGTTIGNYIKETAKSQLSQLAAAEILAGEYGIKADSDVRDRVTEAKEQVIESYGGESGYIDFLEDAHTTDKAIETYLERYEIYSMLYEKITSRGEAAYIEDEDIEADFLEEYSDMLRVQHILVSTQAQTDENGNTVPARSDDEARKIVSEVIAKLDAGEDFDSLIEEYNEDPGITKGNYYVFGSGEMVAEFEDASRELEIGEYTKEGVKTDYGYHIIKRYEINTQIKEFTDYKNSKLAEKAAEVIQSKVDAIDIKSEDKVIDSYIDSWTKELNEAAQESAVNQSTVPVEEDPEALEATEGNQATE